MSYEMLFWLKIDAVVFSFMFSSHIAPAPESAPTADPQCQYSIHYNYFDPTQTGQEYLSFRVKETTSGGTGGVYFANTVT